MMIKPLCCLLGETREFRIQIRNVSMVLGMMQLGKLLRRRTIEDALCHVLGERRKIEELDI